MKLTREETLKHSATKVSAGILYLAGVDQNGVAKAAPCTDGSELPDDFKAWQDIVAISTSEFAIIGLKSDGTVVAAGRDEDGNDEYGETAVEDWKDIVAVFTSPMQTMGL